MPLLKKKTLEKAPMPEFLRDDEEVFHCVMTNEIFRDYEEFAERTILCNSMVWTCSMTGKTNLTYEEALQSEKNAKKMLEDFPVELQVPLLYVANKTMRSSFGEMAEEVYNYMKDRYFVGENIEAFFSSNKWNEYQVVQVVHSIKDTTRNGRNSTESEHSLNPPASQYKYNLEQLRKDDSDVSEKMMADMIQIRRKKAIFTKEKSKLFLKQYVEQNSEGVLKIKDVTIEKFGLNQLKFKELFDGPEPVFVKNVKKIVKKTKQETLAKFLSKNNIMENKKEKDPLKQEEQQRKIEEMKQQKIKEKEMLKQKNMEIASKLRDWYMPKEDLILEDQKKLPEVVPLKCKIPDSLLGDALCIMEFVNNFASILKTKYYFGHGLTLKAMERALTEKKAGGPLIDLFMALLDAIFVLQEEEAQSHKFELEKIRDLKSLKFDEDTEISYTQVTQLATLASHWSKNYQGVPLTSLLFGPVTVTEILRLHLLTSGARYIDSHGAKNRSYSRGVLTSEEDPAVHFRLHNSYILKSLSIHNVLELPVTDKLKLLNCLVDQLLTFKQIRDKIDEQMERSRDLKQNIKQAQINEKRRAIEYSTEKGKITRNDQENKQEKLETLSKENDSSKLENQKLIEEYNDELVNYLTILGHDRAYRQYLKLSSIPGIFINHNDPNSGLCLNEAVHNVPELVNADRSAVMKYLHKISEEMNTSDKENEPKEEKPKMNGHFHPVANGIKEDTVTNELLMCSSDPTTCIVHSTPKQYWSYIPDCETFDQYINTLNKRGLRESELLSTFESGYEKLSKVINKTPVNLIDGSDRGEQKLRDENLGYADEMDIPDVMCAALIDTILKLEDKLYTANLGGIPESYRETWRTQLEGKDFESMQIDINTKTEPAVKLENSEEDEPMEEEYVDPGNYVNINQVDIESEDSDEDLNVILLSQSESEKNNIKYLARAMLQIANSVKSMYLTRPLGEITNKSLAMLPQNLLAKWSKSLLSSTSYSQIFVHYGTLNTCIHWKKSILNSRCRVCRKGGNADQLLLCDSCNQGQHLYCFKPKKTSVPEGEWFCINCSAIKKRELKEQQKQEKMEQDELEYLAQQQTNGEERQPLNCTLCGDLESDEMVSCANCPKAYHLECVDPPMRRVPRGKWLCTKCKDAETHQEENRRSSRVRDSTDDNRRSSRMRDEADSELPLHNVALQELLIDVMRHEDAWPFITPVQKREVPDYYEIIKNPMDFGTIKYKLNMGEYKYDEEFMNDVGLVFENCNTYNNSADEVYKCGVRVLKYFIKRCTERHLRAPEDIPLYEENETNKGVDREDYGPQSKRIRTK